MQSRPVGEGGSAGWTRSLAGVLPPYSFYPQEWYPMLQAEKPHSKHREQARHLLCAGHQSNGKSLSL